MKIFKSAILLITISITSLTFAQTGNSSSNAQGNTHWGINGNSADSTSYIGTTNNQDLIFKSNDVEGLRLVEEGDAIFYGPTPTLGGTITAIASNTITISLTSDGSCGTIAGSAPSNGDFILIIKNSIAESYGARGYFMEVQLTNSDTTEAELFSIGSEVFKSFP